jgi:hypothetical protein
LLLQSKKIFIFFFLFLPIGRMRVCQRQSSVLLWGNGELDVCDVFDDNNESVDVVGHVGSIVGKVNGGDENVGIEE